MVDTTRAPPSMRRMRSLTMAAAQPVTPLTATALQYQWAQLAPATEPTDAELKQRIETTSRLSITPVAEDEDEDADDDEPEALAQEEPKPTPWQSTLDLPDRRVMVQRILALTEKRNRPVPAATTAPTPAITAPQTAETPATRRQERRTVAGPARPMAATSYSEGATALAKRIELSLYSRAGSLGEYTNTATLRRRLQSLVSLSFHEAAATKDETNGLTVPSIAFLGSKRQRPTSSTRPQMLKRRRITQCRSLAVVSNSSGRIMGSLPEDCLRAVFSFLEGRQVMKLRCLSQFAADFLPSCVASLEIEVTRLYQCFSRDANYSTLRGMTNLTRLVVFKSANPCLVPTSSDQKLALHAWGCSELDVTHNNTGELVIQHLANALEAGAGRNLRELQLVSTFTNTSRRNGLRALCQALARGACPKLHDLLIGGNSITDAGAGDIARLLESRALPSLVRLDLRRNYIGECGLRRLMMALSTAATPLKKLKYLCLGGNLITDNCVLPLTEVLASGVCPQMRFLGLEDNFLSPEGVQTIIQSAVTGGMVPKLHRVSSDGGVMA